MSPDSNTIVVHQMVSHSKVSSRTYWKTVSKKVAQSFEPNIKRDAWTLQELEEYALINAYRVHVNKWAGIAKALPGRSKCGTLILIKGKWIKSRRAVKGLWHNVKLKILG